MRECEPECTETLLEVEAYLDGEVDAALAGRITEHLSDCSPCMDRAEFRRHLKDLVQSKCEERAVPDVLRERIQHLIADP
ncbi:MAG TPA: mycothiol system anti-sigma-R factor [Actinomycetota bacterium]|nr:mycothiol system anti-sigma-R factor [Actinomycetota bacterium]